MTTKIKEAITDYWGERCQAHDPDCNCCDAWAEFDKIAALESDNATLRTDRGEFRNGVLKLADELAKVQAENAKLRAACESALAYIPGSEVRSWPPGFALKKQAIEQLTAAIKGDG